MTDLGISFENVSKVIEKNTIFENVNIYLDYGKIYGFVGRNGSGKTIALKMICGFVKPTTGSICIDGNNIFKRNYFNGEIRALIENPKFINDLSGIENLRLLASIQKKIGDDEIEKLLKKLNLYSEKDKKYSKYSLGMKQKLGIIQVFMENPKIILLDEPFNGLDESSVSIVKKLIKEEKDKGKLIIIASHIKEDLKSLCDEEIVFDSGRVCKAEN